MSKCKVWCQMYEKTKRGESGSVILEVAVIETDFKIKESSLWNLYGFLNSSKFDPKKYLNSVYWEWGNPLEKYKSAKQALLNGVTFEFSEKDARRNAERYGHRGYQEGDPDAIELDFRVDSMSPDVRIGMNRKRPFYRQYDLCCRIHSSQTSDDLLIYDQSDNDCLFLFKKNNNGRLCSLNIRPLVEVIRSYTPCGRGLRDKLISSGFNIRISEIDLPRFIESLREAVEWDEFEDLHPRAPQDAGDNQRDND